MTYHGDCIGPVGAHIYHGTCPRIWVSEFTGREHTCDCVCHSSNDMNTGDEGGMIEQADEVRQHPIGSDRPTHMPSREA